MSISFIYPFISSVKLHDYPFSLNFLLLSFLFIYSPNSNSQSLSAEQIYKKVSGAVVEFMLMMIMIN